MKKLTFKTLLMLLMAPLSYSAVLDNNDHILPDVIEIFRSYKRILLSSKKIPQQRLHAILNDATPTIEELNLLAQDKFLRPAKLERLDEKAKEFYNKTNGYLTDLQKESVLKLFENIGDIDERKPQLSKYHDILILGSTAQNMRDRVMYLSNFFQDDAFIEGDNVTITFLTGDRKLFETETEQVIIDPKPYKINPQWQQPLSLPTNENELAPWIYYQLELPEKMRKIPVNFIGSNKREGENRAQTNDTIKAWAEKSLQNPQSIGVKNCLIVSSNPFVDYQVLTTALTLKEMGIKHSFKFDGIGPAADPEKYEPAVALGILLDNLARLIYTQIKIKNSY